VIFNLHRTDALQVNFTGINAPSGGVTIRQLTGAHIIDTNESAENIIVTTQSTSTFDPAQTMTLPPFSMTVFISDPSAAAGRRRSARH
jgi:hypothetical protein